MKVRYSLLCLVILLFCVHANGQGKETIRLPIKVASGYAGFPLSFGSLHLKNMKDLDPGNPFIAMEADVTGIPENWTEVAKEFILLDIKQFVYQNFKQGNIDAAFFDQAKKAMDIQLGARAFSDKPIKSVVYIITGKNKNGALRYKLDTNNNLDFADEKEQVPLTLNDKDWANMDSISKQAHTVHYQSLRNGVVTNMTAPLFIFENKGIIQYNVPQYAEAILDGSIIKICSQKFHSTAYEQATIYIQDTTANKGYGLIEQNEFITIKGALYKNLGVNVNEQILTLQKMPADSIIHSTQVGFYAKPFTGKDFATQQELSLKSYKGKYLYLEFWGSWCVPCLQELPFIKAAYNELDTSRIAFLGIAKDNPDALRAILKKESIGWNQILCETEEGIISDYEIHAYPTSFLIDPAGKIVARNLRGGFLLKIIKHFMSELE